MPHRLQPIFLAGPTAVGKSELALVLAERLGGEIISVDSMQVYRGLDIGTAKPSPAERARVPHHLLDILEITEAFDACRFVTLAGPAVAAIQARGQVPILCGGTGLYFKAFLEGLGQAPPTEPSLRAELEKTPLPELLRELAERDPATYEKIDRHNPRRVYRALEVIRLTGRPFSEQRAAWAAVPQPSKSAVSPASKPAALESRQPTESSAQRLDRAFVLWREPEELKRRINLRAEAMFQRGLVAETEQLLAKGLAENKFAMQALGYRQAVEFLQGARPLPETIELVKTRTRRFAKHQLTWFRRYAQWTWLTLAADEPADCQAEKLLRLCRAD